MALVLAAAGSITAVAVANIVSAEDTVILDNDFESGSYAPWGPRGGVTLAITADGRESANSLSVTGRTADWNGVSVSSAGLLQPGGTYTFSAWVKLPAGTAGTTGIHFTAEQMPAGGGSNTYQWIGNAVNTTADGWVEIGGAYTFPEGLASANLYIEAAAIEGVHPSFLVDDILITGQSATRTVSAVDFEDGTTGTWTQSGDVTLTVGDLPEGGKALSIVDRDNDYEGIQSPTGIFENGATYTLSMRARLGAGTAGDAEVRFVAKPAFTWIGNQAITADAWTTISGTWTAPMETNPAEFQIYIGSENLAAPYTIVVDDILITTEGGDGLPPDFVPGGAINPVPTPVSLATGTGNVAALTFDDGPNPGTTPQLLDFLGEHDIKAVFCVIGQQINASGGADILRRIVNEGHVLCNHSTSFADMGSWTAAQAQADMIANMNIIRTALGNPNAPIPFWRAPNGSWGATQNVAVSLGMQPLAVVNTISDWETQDIPTLTANLRAAMKPGEIVLTHDGGGDRSGTLAAVQTVVTERLAAGWTFTFPLGTPPPPGEIVIDTDFEDGFDGWVPRDGGPGAPTLELSPVAHGGTQAALITNRVNQGAGIGHDVTGLLDGGVTYELTAWLRFADGQTIDEIWLSLQSTTGGSQSFSTLAQFENITNTGYTEVTARFTMPAADSAFIYFETQYVGGDTGNTSPFLVDDIVLRVPEPAVIEDIPGIHTTVDFPVGVAIDSRETAGSPSQLLRRHFNQVSPENHMKPEAWYDADRNFVRHAQATAIMDFAQENDLRVYGHTLVWHSQTPAWFFQNAAGEPLTNSEADKQILRDRLRTHIFNIAQNLSTDYGPFGSDTNPLVAWDVVNEVVSDSGDFADGLRRSNWYNVLGEEFIDLAFRWANEAFNDVYAADGVTHPVTLFINDYNTEQGGKRTRYHDLVQRLLGRGVPVDGVGHQFHVNLAMPISALNDAIVAFQDLPVTQVVTELDVPTGTPVSEALFIEQGYYYRDAFNVFRAHADDLFAVTIWGLTDGRSWRSGNGAPLIFNDALQAKPAYYGAVGGADLPARLRTANVFAGTVPLDASATTSLEWKKLPLNPVEDLAGFQLRWAPDHLTAYATVNDGDVEATDAVTFDLEGTTYVVERDGSTTGGATAVVSSREGGYAVVAHLPLSGAAQGDTLSLDVRATDGDVTKGWNTSGAMGTLSLVEELSYLEVREAAATPAIDGAVDGAWADANAVTTAKEISGTGGAIATVRTLWQGQTLYVLAEVADPIVDVSGSDPWIQDSVEIYVDAGNFKNGAYRFDDTQIRINADNAVSFGTGDEAFQASRLQSAAARTPTGYTIEAAISLLEYGGLGTFHGLDFQVNDGTAGTRTAIRNWADPTGTGYQTTARWGVGQLVAGVERIENIAAPRILGIPLRGLPVLALPGRWSVSGVSFTFQWQRDGVDIAGADEIIYIIKKADVGHQLTVVVTAHKSGYDPVSAESPPVRARDWHQFFE